MKRKFNLLQGYVVNALALHAQGALGFIGIGKETTFGTAVAATDYFEAMSESLSETIERFPTRALVGGFHEPDDYAGLRRSAGSISMMGHPVSLGILLKAAMNTVSGVAVESGYLHLSRFITTKSLFAAGVAGQPYTIEVNRDVTSSQQYAGAICSRLQLSLQPNQDLKVTADFIAKSMLNIAKTTPTFPASPTAPFTFETASLSIGGSATARWESFQLTVDNQLEGIPTLNGANTIQAVRRKGPQTVKVSGTLDFQDIAELNDFKNQTERQLQLTLTRANSFQLLIDIPRFVYTAFPTGMSGADRQTIGVEGMARYSTTSLLAVDFGLTTTKSNF